LDVSRARFVTHTLLSVGACNRSSLPAVIHHVAADTGVTPAQIVGPSRLRPHVQARQEVMRVAHRVMGLSLSVIGKALGDRDHTTVWAGVLAAERRQVR
jgi:chromosomal replication initiation ATPase DnaA